MDEHQLLKGAPVRDRILAEVADRVEAAKRKHPVGRLVSISIGDHPEVAVYIRNQARSAAKVGIPFEEQKWPEQLTQAECKARIVAMNDDPIVNRLQRLIEDCEGHLERARSALQQHPLLGLGAFMNWQAPDSDFVVIQGWHVYRTSPDGVTFRLTPASTMVAVKTAPIAAGPNPRAAR